MQELTELAGKGKREAFIKLYEKNRKETKLVCFGLLMDEEAANYAAAAAFKSTWNLLLDGSISTEEEFRQKLLGNAAVYCRKKVLKKGQKALPLPLNKNFAVTANQSAAVTDGNVLEIILAPFPLAGRFVFVLHQIAGFQPKEIAAFTGLNSKTVGLALDAEQQNIERIIGNISQKSGDYSRGTSEFLDETILSEMQEARLPKEQEIQILESIDAYIAPLVKAKSRKYMVYGGIVIAAAAVIALCIWAAATGGKKDGSIGEQTETADSSVAEDRKASCYAEISIQDYGTITVALDKDAAPQTVENFVSLAESGFYDGLTFHRIMEGFMMQGGDPNGDGSGGSDETIPGEFAENGFDNPLSHTRGAISMARSNDNDSASSQFFIVHQDSTFLDGQYAVFGYVTEGMDVVDAVCTEAEPTDGNGTIPSDEQPVITSIKIRDAE